MTEGSKECVYFFFRLYSVYTSIIVLYMVPKNFSEKKLWHKKYL